MPGTTNLGAYAITPEYDEYGRVRRVLRVKPTGSDQFSEWQETSFDETGRVTALKDCSGDNHTISYDAGGNVVGVTTERNGARITCELTRDEEGRVTEVLLPTGTETYDYDPAGNPAVVHLKRGQSEAHVEFTEGRPKSLMQFDGGQVEFDYYDDGPTQGLLKTVRTPAINLRYHYNAGRTLTGVDCGDSCRVTYGYDQNGKLTSLRYSQRTTRE